MTRYLLFDSACSQCAAVAAGVEQASGQSIRALSLYAREAKRLLDRAGAAGTFQATLIEDDGDTVRAYTGLGLRTHLFTFLNPLRILRIARVVRRARAPLFGRGEARQPNPHVAAEWAAREGDTTAKAGAAVTPSERRV
jgi:predicted DCC family thiol-disulfide oxidoreductase YuxK